MVEHPTLQSAEHDLDGTVKRRRRPALSCVECRIRKVKCDRRKPCGACSRIKSATCTYRPRRIGIRSQSEGSPETTSAFARDRHDTNYHTVGHGFTKPLAIHNKHGRRVTHSESFREISQATPDLLLVDRSTIEASSHSDDGSASVISSLLERINSLEAKLAMTTLDDQLQDGNREGPGPATGQFIKSKFYGGSHWMNAMEPYGALGGINTVVNGNTNRTEVKESSELYTTVSDIKRMARVIKTSRMLQPNLVPEVLDSIPTKQVCDQLVEGYFRTFEGVYRVLHVPSFRKEYEAYWDGTGSSRPSVVLKILLVCAIGVAFYTGSDQASLRTSTAKWIQAAASWQAAPHVKSRLNMTGLQISILIILARQVCNIDGDHVWISTGALLRTAMLLGLHRDPLNFEKIGMYHAEMRRRLWATVLEITVQSSLDMGMPSMISTEDYDTKAPANINDEEIGKVSEVSFISSPSSTFTACSVQITFMQTLPIRLEVVRLINSLQPNISYPTILRLGTDLTRGCRELTLFLRASLAAGHPITPFQIKLSDALLRRFILNLHRPFFAQGNVNPQHHFSRKICLDTSLAILAPTTTADEEDDWMRLTYRCVGFYKHIVLFAISTVYFELNTVLREYREDCTYTLLAPTQPNTPPPPFATLRALLEKAYTMSLSRLTAGETNAKGAVFLASALARIDALVAGTDADAAVLCAAKTAIRETTQILQTVYREEHGVEIDLSLPNGLFWGRDQWRGEGADDVTGTGNRTGTSVTGGEGHAYGDGGGGMMSGFGDLYAGMGMDLDLNAYLQGQSMGTDNDYHFGRSPDWFFDLFGSEGSAHST